MKKAPIPIIMCLVFSILILAVPIHAAEQNSTQVTYTYDDLNRLIKVSYENGSNINYFYDAAGNITSITQTVGFIYGDVNGDLSVNITDAVLVLKYITDPSIEIDLLSADVNADSSINITDTVLILNHITNPDVPFPAEH